MFSPGCSNGRALSMNPKVGGWGTHLDQDIFSLKNFHTSSKTSVHESKTNAVAHAQLTSQMKTFQKNIRLSHLMTTNIMVNHGSDNGLVAWWQVIICTNAILLEIIDICLSAISQKKVMLAKTLHLKSGFMPGANELIINCIISSVMDQTCPTF